MLSWKHQSYCSYESADPKENSQFMHLLNHPISVNAQQEYSLFKCKEPSPTITVAEGTFTTEKDLALDEYNEKQ